MIEHNPEAALGVVLNRPSEVALDDALPEWATIAAAPGVAFVGGPVQADDALIGLAQLGPDARPAAEEADGWYPLLERFGTVDLGRAPLDLGLGIERARVFAGYAAWGP